MSNNTVIKPLTLALGATFVTSLTGTMIANAAENPFSMTELSSGYMVSENAEGKCGEGKMKGTEGKCGEGKMKGTEGKCGEGKMKGTEGKCGSAEKKAEEGKCGGK